MMKKILILIITIGSIQFSKAQSEDYTWTKSFAKAKEIAQKENKKILLFFTGSDWCSPCKMLRADVIESEKFKELTANTVLYEADFPRAKDLVTKEQQRENKALKRKYHINSYPTLLIIDKNGNVVAKKKSYNLMRVPTYHFDFLKQNLD